MISHIFSTTIAVTDQTAALDFYVNTLGWEKVIDVMVEDDLRWLTIVPPGAATQLVLSQASAASNDDAPAKIGGDSGIALVTPDIDATYKTLTTRGVTFTQPVTVMPWGQKAAWWFTDPDGNEFFLLAA